MTRVLVVSSDVVDQNMGGMGIRYWEIAAALAQHCQVTLAVPNPTDLSSDILRVVSFDLMRGDLKLWAAQADVIVLQGAVLHFHPYLAGLGVPLAVDLYVPALLEGLVWHDQDDWATWIPAYEEYLRVQIELIRAGDFFFCASERQRDYWLGWLHALKRINPHTFRQDPSLYRLLAIVPFGLPSHEPLADKPVLKGVVPGIDQGAQVILWTGGLWDWLDPLSAIRAVAELVPTHPQLKLYFMGTHHPNSSVSGMTMPAQAIALSGALGLTGKHIFFGAWTPYHERVNYLMEADASLVAHPLHIETHFSFRTRVLDCIWTRLPLVVTAGDLMADWVRSNNLGIVTPPQNVPAMAQAIVQVLAKGRAAFAPSFDSLRQALTWERAVVPLVEFCLHPQLAPDQGHYLTETERIAQAKDAFLNRVVQDKDAFLAQVIQSKDAFLEQVVQSKDNLLDQVSRDKDAHLQQIVQDKDAQLARITQEKFEAEQRARAQSQELDWLRTRLPIRLYLKILRRLGMIK